MPLSSLTAEPQAQSALRAFAGLGLFALTLVAYLPFLDTGFAATDSLPLVETSRLSGLTDVARLFSGPVMAGTRFAQGEVVYRPFVSLTFGVDHALWGMNAVGYHLTNLVLHLLAVLGLYAIARQLGLMWWASLAGAALFALHPLVLASVPVIARRDSVMPVMAIAATAACMLASEKACGRRRLFLGVCATVMLCIALLSKESAFAAFGMLPIFVVARALGDGDSIRRALDRLRLLAPYVLVAALVFVIRWRVLGGLGGAPDNSDLLVIDLDKYSQTVGAYTRDFLWPFAGLASSTREVWPRLAAILLTGLGSTLLWLPRRQAAVIAAGTLWVMGFGVFCVLLKIGTIAWLAYFALLGVGLLVAGGLEGAVARLRWPVAGMRGTLLRAASVLLLLVLGGFALSALWASALVRPYDQWRTAGEVTRRYSHALADCVASAPQGRRVNLRDLPSSMDDGRVETSLLGVTLLEDWTVESALRLAFPERHLDLSVSSWGTLRGGADTLEFTCSQVANGVELTTRYGT